MDQSKDSKEGHLGGRGGQGYLQVCGEPQPLAAASGPDSPQGPSLRDFCSLCCPESKDRGTVVASS